MELDGGGKKVALWIVKVADPSPNNVYCLAIENKFALRRHLL